MMLRLFCVTVYVFNNQGTECLFINHRKLEKWLPPGGKIDPNEIPDVAAVRECLEETGITVKLIGERPRVVGGLIRPHGIQLNTIVPYKLEHIDLVYLAVAEQALNPILNEEEATALQWFSVDTIVEPGFNTFDSVKVWVKELANEIITATK
jgi:8-oxo-dGTP pyrophosphatase MutT (NUDIX family)